MNSSPATLDDWLAQCERMHPIEMDLSLERTVEVKERLRIQFKAALITVAGTNGKGSSCAMLESIALQAGYRVGLYQKPELVHFTERCRVGGRPVDALALLPHFEAVEAARGEITLTKFEFTTLAIARLLAEEPLDLVILEVGLGGRFDSVNAFDGDCALITSIALDHTEFLGPDREAIGFEKAGIMRPGRPAIVSDPQPPQSVMAHAEKIGADLWRVGHDFGHREDHLQWNWFGRDQRVDGLDRPALRGSNQLLNAAGVLASFDALRKRLPVSEQAMREGLARVELPARFQIVPGRPTLVLDVAHNPQSVAALALNLGAMGSYPRTLAVFGAMRDKDIAGALDSIRPLIDAWHVCNLPTGRAATAAELATLLGVQAETHCHASPADALRAATQSASPADRIVVFGSFFTVGGVLKGNPRLATACISGESSVARPG